MLRWPVAMIPDYDTVSNTISYARVEGKGACKVMQLENVRGDDRGYVQEVKSNLNVGSKVGFSSSLQSRLEGV